MPGATYVPGEIKIIPDVYVRVFNAGELPSPLVNGRGAAIFRADKGPFTPTLVKQIETLDQYFGKGGTTDVAREMLRAGVAEVLCQRLNGTGGVVATTNLMDTTPTTPVAVLRAEGLDAGTEANNVRMTIRDSLIDSTKREFIVYTYDPTTAVLTLRETYVFAKGSGGVGEPQALFNAVMAGPSGTSVSKHLKLVKLADGNLILAAITAGAASGQLGTTAAGVNPTIANGDYTTATTAIENESWNGLATDTEDQTLRLTLEAYIDRIRAEGKRRFVVFADPSSVPENTRITNVQAFDNEAVLFFTNGLKDNGRTLDGYRAAAFAAGHAVKIEVGESLDNWTVVAQGGSVVTPLDRESKESSISAGGAYFDVNAWNEVVIGPGITTFRTETATKDAGWKKFRRLRTRDTLIDEIVIRWDRMRGRLPNTDQATTRGAGRPAFVAAAQGVIEDYRRRGLILSGTVMENPDEVPSGDTASWIALVLDLDNVAKAFLAIGFEF